jgi:hypothetical protein
MKPVDTMNIRPLHVIFGPEWREVDVLRLFDPDIKPRLLYVEDRGQRVIVSQSINAVTRTLMPRYRSRGSYTLWDMYTRSRQHVPLVGKTARAYLDKLFETPEPESLAAPQFEYPLVTLSGTMYREPVDDFNAQEHCARCRYLAECHAIVMEHDGFALCESVLNSELMMEVQYA